MLHVICNVSYVAFHIICIIVFPKKLFFLKISNPKKISEQELTLVSDWGDTLEAHTDTRRESFTWLIYDSFTAFISYWNIMLIYCWWLVSDDVIMTSLMTSFDFIPGFKNESSHYLKLLSIQSNSIRDRPDGPTDMDGLVRCRGLGSGQWRTLI